MKIGKLYKIISGPVLFDLTTEYYSKYILLEESSVFLLLDCIMTPEERCHNLSCYKELIILYKNKIYFRQINPKLFNVWFEDLC